MNIITALAISIGVLAVGATWLSLGTSLGLLVWAIFIGWGSFFHSGGKMKGLTDSAAAHVWGVIVASVALFLVGTIGGSVIVTSIIVGVTVAVLVLGAHIPQLATIPAGVYGYASTAAFFLLSGVALTDIKAVAAAAGAVALSLVAGNVFGFVSEKGAGMLTKSGS